MKLIFALLFALLLTACNDDDPIRALTGQPPVDNTPTVPSTCPNGHCWGTQ